MHVKTSQNKTAGCARNPLKHKLRTFVLSQEEMIFYSFMQHNTTMYWHPIYENYRKLCNTVTVANYMNGAFLENPKIPGNSLFPATNSRVHQVQSIK